MNKLGPYRPKKTPRETPAVQHEIKFITLHQPPNSSIFEVTELSVVFSDLLGPKKCWRNAPPKKKSQLFWGPSWVTSWTIWATASIHQFQVQQFDASHHPTSRSKAHHRAAPKWGIVIAWTPYENDPISEILRGGDQNIYYVGILHAWDGMGCMSCHVMWLWCDGMSCHGDVMVMWWWWWWWWWWDVMVCMQYLHIMYPVYRAREFYDFNIQYWPPAAPQWGFGSRASCWPQGRSITMSSGCIASSCFFTLRKTQELTEVLVIVQIINSMMKNQYQTQVKGYSYWWA